MIDSCFVIFFVFYRNGLNIHIRRITNHYIKAALGKDLWELLLPVESLVASNGRIANQRVATLDVLV